MCASWYGKYAIPDTVTGHIAKYYLTDSRLDSTAPAYQQSAAFEEYLVSNGMRVATERKFGLTSLRWAAIQSGIGIVRKNNFFYTEKGSWINLEAFLIDEELTYIIPNTISRCPEGCTLCARSCPTKSLSEPYMMNRNSCVSCLTTWDGWDLTTNPYSKQLGQWIFGCDACQDVCPFNRNAWTGEECFPSLNELCEHLSLVEIVQADYDFLQNVVQPKLWYIPKDKVWRYKTNALNAMLNGFKPEYLPAIQKACQDEYEQVRKMAQWVLSQKEALT